MTDKHNPDLQSDLPSSADPGPADLTIPASVEAGAQPSSSFSHLDAGVAALLKLPVAERIERIMGDVLVIHGCLATILNEARWMVMAPRTQRARGLIVVAAPGSGKTAVSELLKLQYPIDAEEPGSPARARVLALSISGVRTTKAVLSRVLLATSAPLARRYTISDHEELALDLLRRMQVRLLILDEVQDLLNVRESEQLRVMEVLKHFMNELRLPILGLGTSPAAGAFKADPHLSARFECRVLPRWQEGEEFGQFLTAYEGRLPLRYRSDLCRPAAQKALIKASGGILDGIVRRIKAAAIQAVVDGTERITPESLELDHLRPSVDVLCGDTPI